MFSIKRVSENQKEKVRKMQKKMLHPVPKKELFLSLYKSKTPGTVLLLHKKINKEKKKKKLPLLHLIPTKFFPTEKSLSNFISLILILIPIPI
jgi:hypothetical protein